MGIATIILLGILVAVLVYAVGIYNALVQIKHNVTKAWANIDVLLKQRHDELPEAGRNLQAVHEIRAGHADHA